MCKILICFILILTIKHKQPNESEECKNFHQYACRNYTQIEITQKLDMDFNMKLLKQLEEVSNYSETILQQPQTYKNKLILYWLSCKRETQRNVQKYFEIIKPSPVLNWPLLGHTQQWQKSNKTFNFWPLLGVMQSYGLNNVILQTEIIRNIKNTLNIYLAPAFLTNETLTQENIVWQYLLKALDIPEQEQEFIIQQIIRTSEKFQDLARGSDLKDSQVLTLQDLHSHYPKLKLYLQLLLGQKEMDNILFVTITESQYLNKLNNTTWSKQEQIELSNYLMLKFLFYIVKDSTPEFTALECIKDLRNKFDLAVNTYYHDVLLTPRNYTLLVTKVNKMQQTLKDIIKKYFLENRLRLSEEQIFFLINKLYNIKVNIGNLPLNFNASTINNFYKDLPNLAADNYYKNHLLLLKHRFQKSLLYTQNQTHFVVTNNEVGGISLPFYIPQQNMVVIPFGSFQRPLFDLQQQTPLQQLSVFGFILAHELAHAFDTTGLLYDEQGLLLTTSKGIAESPRYSNTLKCLQKQKPTEDIDERIADLFGARVAYDACRRFYPYRSFEWKRKFFINLSKFFCGKDDNIEYVDHDSDEVRLQQIVRNFPEFAWAFKCPKQSGSYPKIKCRLF